MNKLFVFALLALVAACAAAPGLIRRGEELTSGRLDPSRFMLRSMKKSTTPIIKLDDESAPGDFKLDEQSAPGGIKPDDEAVSGVDTPSHDLDKRAIYYRGLPAYYRVPEYEYEYSYPSYYSSAYSYPYYSRYII